MAVEINVVSASHKSSDAQKIIFIGKKAALKAETTLKNVPRDLKNQWATMVDSVAAGSKGGSTQTWLSGSSTQVFVGVLPEQCSRHNSPGRPDAVFSLVKKAGAPKGKARIWVIVQEKEQAGAAAVATGRAFPTFSWKTTGAKKKTKKSAALTVLSLCGGRISNKDLQRRVDASRWCAELVDMPTNRLHTKSFSKLAKELAEDLDVTCTIIRGKDLKKKGFGGLWNVGKTAINEPALVVLTHDPPKAKKTITWVGKGIVYDTGGLSIKGKNFMPGMKCDMGGAAAVIGAFKAAVEGGCKDRLHAILCLAENSVGPEATRPDDVITLYSGKTVEVNNTDAEGRLVLGDGVAYAVKHLDPDVIVDLATLTGAQLIATGRNFAGIVCNDDDLEARAIKAGRRSGDLVHPLPYAPEFFKSEFSSKVADMKNSVKDRSNAQSSCAGQFVANHLGKYDKLWLHVDLAGPSFRVERGTGFGVNLLLELFDL